MLLTGNLIKATSRPNYMLQQAHIAYKVTQILICQFLPSTYIFYVEYFGYLAVVKTFLSVI